MPGTDPKASARASQIGGPNFRMNDMHRVSYETEVVLAGVAIGRDAPGLGWGNGEASAVGMARLADPL